MVVTASTQNQSQSGVRPININRDIPRIMKLLETCFGHTMKPVDQRFLTNSALLDSPAVFWRLSPIASKLALGFVWEKNGRLVGNATVLTSKIKGRYLVVNVAVAPDFRRRGIAQQLMMAVEKMVRERNGRYILLQVDKENEAAVGLYKALQYTQLGSVTSWYAPVSRLRQISPTFGGKTAPPIRELRYSEWQAAYQLDIAALTSDLNWPEPIDSDFYKKGVLRRMADFVNGRRIETWVTTNQGQLTGHASILTEWGKFHMAAIRIHPDWRGELERPLFAKLLRRLSYLPRRNVRINHPDDDELMSSLLKEANFEPRRTLTHMRLDVGA